jgi:hypothetical protein
LRLAEQGEWGSGWLGCWNLRCGSGRKSGASSIWRGFAGRAGLSVPDGRGQQAWRLKARPRVYECASCHRQVSVTAGACFIAPARSRSPMAGWWRWSGCRRVGPPLGERVGSFAIITTRPNELCAELHNRMPVILGLRTRPAWLGEDPAEVARLKAMLAPTPTDEMTCWLARRGSPIVLRHGRAPRLRAARRARFRRGQEAAAPKSRRSR